MHLSNTLTTIPCDSIDQGQGSYTDGNFGRAPLTAYRMPGTAQRPPMSQMGRNNHMPPGSRSGVPVSCRYK